MNFSFSVLRVVCVNLWVFLVITPINAQITGDGTLSVPTTVKNEGNGKFVITNGTQLGNNLFQSFQEFSIPTNGSAIFDIPSSVKNIIGRVTGNNASFLDGSLQVNGQANLFFLNPNGIIFGKNATLNISGSFLATTAEALLFDNKQVFSATPSPTDSLLKVSVPVGLQFGTRANGIIVQQSRLSLPSEKTLGLVGGELSLNRADVFAPAGRIELGSVGPNSGVSITQNGSGYLLGYGNVKNFQDIHLYQGTSVDVTDSAPFFGKTEVGSGTVQVFGRQLSLTDGSVISSVTAGQKPGKTLTINTSESVAFLGTGNLVVNPATAVSSSGLTTITYNNGSAGDINITTPKLIVQDGGAIVTRTELDPNRNPNPLGNSGNITINASDSVTLTGGSPLIDGSSSTSSGFSVETQTRGNAGNLILNTGKLALTNGAGISAQTKSAGQGGNLDIRAKQIELNNQGKLLASSEGKGQAGNLNIQSDQLLLNNSSQITVSSLGTGNAGNLKIKANNVLLNNQSQLIAETATGEGGNIAIDLSGILILRNNSLISTTAGSQGGGGNGGNIEINAKFVVGFPAENSDIIANAFMGQGGNIQINALGIFGIEPRANLTSLNDITASSTFGQLGVISINRVDVDPQSSLLTLPIEIIDPRNLIVQACGPGGEFSQGEFFVTGRGGLPINPQQNLETNTGLTDLGYPSTNISSPKIPETPQSIQSQTEAIVEAQGWFKNSYGKIVLTAQISSGKVNSARVDSPTCYDLPKHFSILSPPIFLDQYSLAQ